MDFFTYFCSMEERKYIVYIHKNKINGKVYVGITHYTNPEKRWSYGYCGNPYFQSAISKYGFKSGTSHPNYGKTPSQDIIEKIRISLSKPVLMIDKNTNEILKEFNSTTEAETFLNAKGHHVSCCCNHKRKTAYGYKWRYKERRE